MSLELIDSFSRSGANLGSNPTGRWNIPAPGGALVSDFKLDGQYATTPTTVTASTLVWAHFYAPSIGRNVGEWGCLAIRGTIQVKAIGVIARAAEDTVNRERYWFGFTNETGVDRFELRLYTAFSTYISVTTPVNMSSVGLSADLAWHKFTVRFTAGTGSLVNILCKYDSTIVFNLVNVVDTLTGLGFTTYRAPGIQYLTSSAWISLGFTTPGPGPVTGTDFASFDDAYYDNLIAPIVDPAPTLEAEPTFTPVAIGGEADDVGSAIPLNPDYGEEVTEVFNSVTLRTESSWPVSWPLATRGRRYFSLKWGVIDALSTLGVAIFQQDNLGQVRAFSYVGPDDATYLVHILSETIEFQQVAPNVFTDVSAIFEELIA